MGFQINYGGYAFVVPGDVVDHYLRLAGETELKVLLFLLRFAGNATAAQTAEFLKLSEEQAEEAFQFWEQAGVLHTGNTMPAGFAFAAPVPSSSASSAELPKAEKSLPISRVGSQRSSKEIKLDPSEIAASLEASEELSGLFALAEKHLARPLTHMEQRSFIWLHQYLNIPCEIILMLLQYCISIDKYSVSYVESIAIRWQSEGILSMKEVEEELRRMTESHTFINELKRLFEMRRSPTSSQMEYVDRWQQKNYPFDLIHYAYEVTIENIEKLNFKYINTILEDMEKHGIKDVSTAKIMRQSRKWSPPSYKKKKPGKQEQLEQMSQREIDEMNEYLSLVNRFEEDSPNE